MEIHMDETTIAGDCFIGALAVILCKGKTIVWICKCCICYFYHSIWSTVFASYEKGSCENYG
jgi:hypothetical protein